MHTLYYIFETLCILTFTMFMNKEIRSQKEIALLTLKVQDIHNNT